MMEMEFAQCGMLVRLRMQYMPTVRERRRVRCGINTVARCCGTMLFGPKLTSLMLPAAKKRELLDQF
jgi:hypothetical protein